MKGNERRHEKNTIVIACGVTGAATASSTWAMPIEQSKNICRRDNAEECRSASDGYVRQRTLPSGHSHLSHNPTYVFVFKHFLLARHIGGCRRKHDFIQKPAWFWKHHALYVFHRGYHGSNLNASSCCAVASRVSLLSFSDKSRTNSPTAEGYKA